MDPVETRPNILKRKTRPNVLKCLETTLKPRLRYLTVLKGIFPSYFVKQNGTNCLSAVFQLCTCNFAEMLMPPASKLKQSTVANPNINVTFNAVLF